MIELIIKMIVCLLIALLLGFAIGWVLSKVIQAKKHIVHLDKLNSKLSDKNDYIEKLKSDDNDKKLALLNLSDENRELKTLLEDKSKLVDEKSMELTHLQQSLNIAQNTVNENFSAKEHNQALVQQVNNLEKLYLKKNNEIKELEEVVIKAEDTIESTYTLLNKKEKQLKEHAVFIKDNIIKKLETEVETLQLLNRELLDSDASCQKKVMELKEELKHASIEREEDEFIISKDQFTHIESQLVQYQKEIDILKEANKALRAKSNEVELFKLSGETSELDDTSIVKLFRDTYKKITKP
jgi:chromosome segregation ATPase